MYQRILQKQLEQLSEHWSVISVTGPRQSGKTTLCQMAFITLEHQGAGKRCTVPS